MFSVYCKEALIENPEKVIDYVAAIRELNRQMEGAAWGPRMELHDEVVFRTEALEGLCKHYRQSRKVEEAQRVQGFLDDIKEPARV